MLLRDYQIDTINKIHDKFCGYDRQYIEMPTGSGKTITFLSYAQKYHKKILIVLPSCQLLDQVYSSSLLFYHKSQISRKGNRFNEKIADIHISIINSISGDYLEFISQYKFDLIIIDEAHRSHGNLYKQLLKRFPNTKVLGVTATPQRSDGLFLEEILHTCSVKISIEELINSKFLCDIEGFRINSNVDIGENRIQNGDFNLKELYKKLSTESRNNLILSLCKNDMKNRKTLIFCINIKHSKEINKLLNENGLSSKHIDGTMKSDERNAILSSFRNGEINYLCNCQLLTEGFDEPSIDGLILARPTLSRSLFIQMIGRGLRISPGKLNCKVVDIVDNFKNISNFTCIISDFSHRNIDSFKSIRDIKEHIIKENVRLTEVKLEKVNIFSNFGYESKDEVPCMIDYLEKNNIKFFEPISFDEASFLIWHNELKKEYTNGNNIRKIK